MVFEVSLHIIKHVDSLYRKYILYKNNLWTPTDNNTLLILNYLDDFIGCEITTKNSNIIFIKNNDNKLHLKYSNKYMLNLEYFKFFNDVKNIDIIFKTFESLEYIIYKIYKIDINDNKTWYHLFDKNI